MINNLFLKLMVENMDHNRLSISWSDNYNKEKLVDFFIENTEVNYISHGELQDGRAIDTDKWAPNIREVLIKEFSNKNKNEDIIQKIAVCESGDVLVGFMNVGIYSTYIKYAILYDIVVLQKFRDKGTGHIMMDWLEKELIKMDVNEIYGESGILNKRAHTFFEKIGFKTTSIIIRKKI